MHALLGENGAGKSTLIKVITGAHQPDSGSIEIEGKPVTRLDPATSRAMGIAAIYQQPALFPDLKCGRKRCARSGDPISYEPHTLE